MRTDQLLREALHSTADQAPTPELMMTRISTRLGTRPGQRRRTRILVLAVTVVLIAVAIILPSVLTNRTGVPADQRIAGNWNLIHRVDPPEGWVERDRWVQTDREGRLLAPSDAPDYAGDNCRVEIFGQGVLSDPVPAGTPSVEINGRPGFAVTDDQRGLVPYGVYWLYADNAWASVSCTEEGTNRALDIARRTVFEPEPFPSGLRLRRLPNGYAANSILQSTPHGQPVSALILKATDPDAEPSGITIVVTPGPTTVPPGTPDYEEERIAGHPTLLNAREMWLTINVDDYSVRIESSDGEPAGRTTSLWPAGRRELLVSVAEDLEFARNLDDPQTWFDAQDVFPR